MWRSQMHLKIQPLTPETLSFYGNHNFNLKDDCGYDLGIAEDTKVYFKATTKINLQVIIVAWETISDSDFTGQSFEDSYNIDYILMPRSSIIKLPYRQSNSLGLIDKNYRGSLSVAIDYLDLETEIQPQKYVEKETGRTYSVIQKGTRLFQLVPFSFSAIQTKQIVDSHDTTERGDKGFGSTNLAKQIGLV